MSTIHILIVFWRQKHDASEGRSLYAGIMGSFKCREVEFLSILMVYPASSSNLKSIRNSLGARMT